MRLGDEAFAKLVVELSAVASGGTAAPAAAATRLHCPGGLGALRSAALPLSRLAACDERR